MKQVLHSLSWLRSFLDHRSSAMTSGFYFRDHFNTAGSLMVATDASVWGLGAVLYIDGVLVAALHSPITSFDTLKFGFALGDEAGQQTWEMLILLVALRHWRGRWEHARVNLQVKSDNLAALTTLTSLKAKALNANFNLIARELALDLGHALYTPSFIVHTPGLSNVLPDWLSRVSQPSRSEPMPAALADVTIDEPIPRSSSYFLAAPLPKSSRGRHMALHKTSQKKMFKHRYLRARLDIVRGRR